MISALRRRNCRVRVEHNRYIRTGVLYTRHEYELSLPYPVWALDVQPRGGVTHISITFPNGTTVTGTAKCSEADNYDKRKGVAIALGRALKGLDMLDPNLWESNGDSRSQTVD